MTEPRSGTYWTTLQNLQDPARLRAAFGECAAHDPAWAIDQARCLYMNVAPDSAQARTIRDFCAGIADETLVRSAPLAALTALRIAAEDSSLAKEQTTRIIGILADIHGTDPRQALAVAAALKAQAGRTSLAQALAGFMIDKVSAGDSAVLLGLVRSGEAARFDDERKDRLLRRIGVIAYEQPYEAALILDEIGREDVPLSPAQEERLTVMRRALAESPEVLLGVLEREYGEDTAALRDALAARKTAPRAPSPRYN